MALVLYDSGKPDGKLLAEIVRDFRALKARITRLKGIFDEITAGGTAKANLETGNATGNAVIGVPVGSGATVYDALVSIKSGIDTPSEATLSSVDLGA